MDDDNLGTPSGPDEPTPEPSEADEAPSGDGGRSTRIPFDAFAFDPTFRERLLAATGITETNERLRQMSAQILGASNLNFAKLFGSHSVAPSTPLSDIFAASQRDRLRLPQPPEQTEEAELDFDKSLPVMDAPTAEELLREAHMSAQLALLEAVRNRAIQGSLNGSLDAYELQALADAYLTLPKPGEDFGDASDAEEDG